ncbi:hypothetical protein CDAR_558221 [Caerostris darwini]|uniref:Uncharacterized protein n=1 Tax=Caerostris darwini TaxID=1538125 RepID=A0AAV4R8X4_9ARAC|nr:hypothetical protein CDAR_558221 [Caerostris darwini]
MQSPHTSAFREDHFYGLEGFWTAISFLRGRPDRSNVPLRGNLGSRCFCCGQVACHYADDIPGSRMEGPHNEPRIAQSNMCCLERHGYS